MSDYPGMCPNCEASLVGEPIPAAMRESYGATHFLRTIGIVDRDLDRVVRWRCQDCDYEWLR